MSDNPIPNSYVLERIFRVLPEIQENCLPKEGELYDDPKRFEKYNAIKDALELIRNPSRLMPHGQWILVGESFDHPHESEIEEKCSLCGRYVQRYGTQPQDLYCPSCGAKMGLDALEREILADDED